MTEIPDRISLPDEVERLSPRQRELMRVIYFKGGATVREVFARIPDPPPSAAGVRTLLNRLTRKGMLKTRPSGRHRELTYLPATSSADVRLTAFRRIAEEHFDGSGIHAIDALENLVSRERE